MPNALHKRLVAAAVCSAIAFTAAPAFAQDTITMSFVNADIRSVVETVGKATGKNFIIDPRVTGTLNIVSQTPVTKDQAYDILLSTLRLSGFATVEE
ncbi:MAG: type II secretion system protein GspD, partial [Burkholderiales bacterium]